MRGNDIMKRGGHIILSLGAWSAKKYWLPIVFSSPRVARRVFRTSIVRTYDGTRKPKARVLAEQRAE